MKIPPPPQIAIEDAINGSVNLIYQLSNELALILEGRDLVPGDKKHAAARAVGITMQADSAAENLMDAFQRLSSQWKGSNSSGMASR